MPNYKVGDLVYSGKYLGIIKKIPKRKDGYGTYWVEWCDGNNTTLTSYGKGIVDIMVSECQRYMGECK
jgi:hypothetical protein